MSTPALPKYAIGVEVPVCELTRVTQLKRGDWVIANYTKDTPLVAAVVDLRISGTKTWVDLAAYPNTERVYPWHFNRGFDNDHLIHRLNGYIE